MGLKNSDTKIYEMCIEVIEQDVKLVFVLKNRKKSEGTSVFDCRKLTPKELG